MMSFRGERLRHYAIPASSVWFLTDIAEAKGKRQLYTQRSPQVLQALREQACPGVSRDMIRRVLQDLQKAGKVECLGKGRSAKWRNKKEGNNGSRG